MAGSSIEPIEGLTHINTVQRKFIEAVDKHFRRNNRAALKQLHHLAGKRPEDDDPGVLITWSRRWCVDAECVRAAAQAYIAEVRQSPRRRRHAIRLSFHSDVNRRDWELTLEALDSSGPVKFNELYDGAARGETVETIPPEREGQWAKFIGRRPQPDVGHLHHTVSAPDEHRIEHPHSLRPLSARPDRRERLDEFLARARDHYLARARMAIREYGFSSVSPKPDLNRHLRWLIRYQLEKEPFKQIAEKDGVTTDAVRKAIERLAHDQLGLTLRRRPRGRPRRP